MNSMEGMFRYGIDEGSGAPEEKTVGSGEVVSDADRKLERGFIDKTIEFSYSAQRRELSEGASVFIQVGDRALILAPGQHTPESGDVPMVEAWEVDVITKRGGIHPDRAVELFKERLNGEASQEPTGT